MTNRKEPTVLIDTAALTITSIFGKKKPDHTQLVSEALDMFTQAEEKMANAVKSIETSIADDKKEIETIGHRIDAQEASKSKLTRVMDRLKALTE